MLIRHKYFGLSTGEPAAQSEKKDLLALGRSRYRMSHRAASVLQVLSACDVAHCIFPTYRPLCRRCPPPPRKAGGPQQYFVSPARLAYLRPWPWQLSHKRTALSRDRRPSQRRIRGCSTKMHSTNRQNKPEGTLLAQLPNRFGSSRPHRAG